MVAANTTDARSLGGTRVLITRPAHQAESLARQIEQAGGRVFRFPTIAIAPPHDLARLHGIFDRLAQFSIAIFVSPNAVERAMMLLEQRGYRLPATLRVGAIGTGSAAALARAGIRPEATPSYRFDSEALLDLPLLQDVTGRHIVIFRGEGGRELLGDALRERGADVTYAECYRRERPNADIAPLQRRLENGEIDIISITSREGLQNLYDMAGETSRPFLLNTPTVVISESQAIACRQLGFHHQPLVATAANDAAILNAIQTWHARRISL